LDKYPGIHNPYALRQWGAKAEGKGVAGDCKSEVSRMQKSVPMNKYYRDCILCKAYMRHYSIGEVAHQTKACELLNWIM